MGFRRGIVIPDPVNGSDCFYVCPGLCYVGGCIPLPPPPPSSSSVQAHRHISNLIIAAGSLVAASFFLALIYYAVFRKRRRRSPLAAASPDPDADDGGFVDHHVWHIRTVGLDEATLSSIAVHEFKAGAEHLDSADCSVCLGELRDGDLVRMLPKCGHAFHVTCIDTWLSSHVNCPLCRSPITDSMGADSGLSNAQQNSHIQPLESDRELFEGGIGVVIDPSAASSSSPEGSELPELSDVLESGLQPVRRSVSMISLPLGTVLPTVDLGESFREEGKKPTFGEEHSSKNKEKQGNETKGSSLRKDPVEMEESLSSSGRKFFFLKYRRSRSLILPL